ncbi:hypothetical protein H5P28_04000 [Ruficoccus amylovorans]|uniref:Peptidase S1 domain-containing protein n=1 Tax=Ruficoccus amylovorans TaxID=1804625 RepID=A0A842HCJ3_9BACT|nr:hypothetical protein [Ruficoccus amylovorans]MBC2593416.1 hypothetical protein [Ruficoccus amylovorans]
MLLIDIPLNVFSKAATFGAILAGSALPLPALILYSGDNSANQTAPANGAPFEQVGSYCNTSPTANASGSVVHLRGKYVLTVDHVQARSNVTFDGEAFHTVDKAFAKIQIGSVDLVIIKLVDDPGLDDLPLNTSTSADISSSTSTVLVGYGRGRSTAQTDAGDPVSWTWGGNSTVAKRWGTNRVTGALALSYTNSSETVTWSYIALTTVLDADAGDDEAAMAELDSGSALFQFINGVWVLSGLTATVETSGSSTFDTAQKVGPVTLPSDADTNYFVRIASYAAEIEAALPDLSTYSGWLTDNSLSGEDAASDADPDADGMTNLEEFAYGTNPNFWDAELGPRVSQTDASLVMDWQQSDTAAGLTYTLEETTDLVGVSFATSSLIPEQVTTEGGVTSWSVTCTPAAGEQRFLRLVVSSSESL